MIERGDASVAGDPAWLPHRFDPSTDAFGFMHVSRQEQSAVPFLTDEYLPKDRPLRAVRRDVAVAAAGEPAPLRYIFHSAYCCSTLLARALDQPGLATSLKEPVLLNDIVGWRRRSAPDAAALQALDASLSLMARPFAVGEAVVIKPSNVAAGLARAMLDLRPTSRAILLHRSLRGYLGSIAQKGLWGRRWVRELYVGLRVDGLIGLGLDPADDLMLTDLQIAAVGWLAQHDVFARLLDRFGPKRVRSLRSEVLSDDPVGSLNAAFGHFGLSPDPEQARRIAAGPVFGDDAKSGSPFAERDRVRGRGGGADDHADEIEKVATWAEAVARAQGIALDLAHPLLATPEGLAR